MNLLYNKLIIPYLFPSVDGVGLRCGLDGLAVLPQVHQTQRQLGVVVDVLEQQTRRLVHSLVEAPFPDTLTRYCKIYKYIQMRDTQ